MFASVLSALLVLAQAATDPAVRPPNFRSPCTCQIDLLEPELIFNGVVVDAEVTVDASGRTANARQATIFRIVRTIKGEVESPAKVWHMTNIKKCGVQFDYGKLYVVYARVVDRVIETDACLTPWASEFPPERPSAVY